jgi:hypothetical protein
MANLFFSIGNSDTGPLGLCARINGTPKEALAILVDHLNSLTRAEGGLELHKLGDADENIDYITLYVNTDFITDDDIYENDDDDDDDDDDNEGEVD